MITTTKLRQAFRWLVAQCTAPWTHLKRKLSISHSEHATTVVEISIGTGDCDFSTITLFEAALDDSDHFPKGSNIVAICHDDSIFEEALILDHRPYGLKSLTIISADGRLDDHNWHMRDHLEGTRSVRFKN